MFKGIMYQDSEWRKPRPVLRCQEVMNRERKQETQRRLKGMNDARLRVFPTCGGLAYTVGGARVGL